MLQPGIAFVPRLSVLIPVRGNLDRLEDTLVSVLENRPEDCEIVVLLDAPYADPYELGGEVCFVEVPAGASRTEAIQLGLRTSQGRIIHLLACGAKVPEGWADLAMEHFSDPWVGAVAPLVVDEHDVERVLSAGLTYHRGGRTRIVGQGQRVDRLGRKPPTLIGPTPEAAFYRRAAIESAGGFSDLFGDELAGADLGLRMTYAGYRTVFEEAAAIRLPWLRPWGNAFSGALAQERLFWRWASCFGYLRSLASHGPTIAGSLLASLARLTAFAEISGRLLGFCYCASGIKHRKRMQEMRDRIRQEAFARSPGVRRVSQRVA